MMLAFLPPVPADRPPHPHPNLPPPSPPPPPRHLPHQRAISLSFLESYFAAHADESATDLASKVLAPALARTPDAATFADHLLASGGDGAAAVLASRPAPGTPYHYVIYDRARPLAETLAMLRTHFTADAQHVKATSAAGDVASAAAGEAYVWLDIFGTPAAAESDAAAAAAVLREAVAGAATALVVLDEEGTALRTLRCLYEVSLAVTLGGGGGDGGRPLRLLTYELDFETLRHVGVCAGVVRVAVLWHF